MLVFLSYFPDETNIRDGMSQRIFHIDNLFQKDKRIYINADLKKYLKKEIIIKRYGLYNTKEMTQKDIAKELHISRSYVSRIEKRAITKILREFMQNKKC